jgi:hypothetical protein
MLDKPGRVNGTYTQQQTSRKARSAPAELIELFIALPSPVAS